MNYENSSQKIQLYTQMSDLWASVNGKGGLVPLDLENFSKKGCFPSFEWGKTNFATFGPPVDKFF